MGKFFNKIRQVFNLFLILLLIAAVASAFVYFMTTPEQRNETFWMSVGFLAFALILETLQAAGIAMRSEKNQGVPVKFTRLILGGLYFVFVIIMAVWNAFSPFTFTKYLLAHIAGLAVFLIPMVLINMAELRLSGSDRKQQAQGRLDLASLANRVNYVADDLKASGIPAQNLTQVVNLAEKIKYSDPTPASGKLERALERAVESLESIAKSKDVNSVLNACTLTERALTERNDYVKNAK